MVQLKLIFRYTCNTCLLLTGMLYAFTSTAQEGYAVQHFDTNNGLPQNQVLWTDFDANGHLWLGTFGGVCRFDGQQFVNYDVTNAPALRSSRIPKYYKSRDNILGCRDVFNNIYRVNNNNEINIDTALSRYKKVAMSQGNFFIYDNMKNNATLAPFFNDPSDFFIYNSYIVNEHECYIQINKSLHYINNASNRVIDLHLPFYKSKDKWFIIGDLFMAWSNDRLYIYKQGILQHDVFMAPACLPIMKMTAQGGGAYYVDQGITYCIGGHDLYQYKIISDTLQPVLLMKGLPLNNEQISFVKTKAAAGVILLGTFDMGLYLYKASAVKAWYAGSKNYNNLADIVRLGNGFYLNNNQRFRIDKELTYPLPKYIPSYRIFRKKDGSVIAGSYFDRLLFYDSNFLLKKQVATKISVGPAFCEDKRGIVWIGGTNKLSTLDKAYHTKQQLVLTNQVTLIFEYSDQYLWIVAGGDLLQYDIAANAITDTIWHNELIRYIYYARDSSIWVATYGNGIYKYHKHVFVHLPMDDKKALVNAHNFYEDDKGFFWIPTNKGLIQCLKKELDDFAEKGNTIPYYYRYGLADGMIIDEFNGGSPSPYAVDNEGNIVYPTINGIVSFNTHTITPLLPTQHINIDAVIVDDSLVDMSHSVSLRPSFSDMQINISMPYFGNIENLVIEYQLSEADAKWYRMGSNKQININRLPAGHYQLQLRVRTGFGSGNYEYKTFSFTVRPYFFKTWWFVMLIGLLLAAAVAAYFKTRNKAVLRSKDRLEQEVKRRTETLNKSLQNLNETQQELYASEQKLYDANQVKEKVIAIILHDLKAPMNYMGISAKMLNENISNLSKEEIKKISEHFVSNTVELSSFVEDLLQWLLTKKESFSPVMITFYIKQLFTEVHNLYKDIALLKNDHIIIDHETSDIKISTDRNILKLIVRNLVDNAIKNTNGGNIIMSATVQNGKTIISVADQGRGMTAAQVNEIVNADKNKELGDKGSFGFDLVRSFLKAINGQLHIDSVPGKGTRVIITLEEG